MEKIPNPVVDEMKRTRLRIMIIIYEMVTIIICDTANPKNFLNETAGILGQSDRNAHCVIHTIIT